MQRFKIISMFLVIVIITGCQSATKSGIDNNSSRQEIKQEKTVPQSVPEPKRDKSAKSVSERLTTLAKHVPQVNDATAIVFGDYAIVGIDVDAKLDRSRVGVIKYSVAEALKDDPLGANALVTSDPDIVQRLREINVDLKRGHIIKGLAEELSDIYGRIMPIAPKSVEMESQQNKKNNLVK